MKINASFDDGGVADVQIAELMAKYEIPTTFYIPILWQKVNALKGRRSISLDELRHIAQGHEIGAHTISHPQLPSLSDDAAFEEIAESRILLSDLVYKPINSFCYPRGKYTEKIKSMVREAGFSDARTTKVGQITPSEDPYETHTAVHVGYNRKEYGGDDWLTHAIHLFDLAQLRDNAQGDAVYHLWGHGFELEREDNMQRLEQLVKVIAS